VLVSYSVLAMGTMATALSTRFSLLSNLVICFALFNLGLMSDYLFGRFADTNVVARFLYACIPNWQLLWMADALAAEKTIPGRYLLYSAGYISLIVGLFLIVAALLFARREVGDQGIT
jgi:hypothetical protein